MFGGAHITPLAPINRAVTRGYSIRKILEFVRTAEQPGRQNLQSATANWLRKLTKYPRPNTIRNWRLRGEPVA